MKINWKAFWRDFEEWADAKPLDKESKEYLEEAFGEKFREELHNFSYDLESTIEDVVNTCLRKHLK